MIFLFVLSRDISSSMMGRSCGESVFIFLSCLIMVCFHLMCFDVVLQVGESGAGGHVFCIYPHHEVSLYTHSKGIYNVTNHFYGK